jgi:hypothetical protein
MAEVFTDYQGCKIRLTDERKQHILDHPEMAEMESAIELALTNPEIVRRSNTDNTVYLYYRYHEGTSVGDKWLCVVVKYLENDAFIITAYLTDKLKAGEQICPKP